MYFVDSWVWIEYFRPRTAGEKAKGVIDGGEELVTSTASVAEVYYKFLAEASEEDAEKALAFIKKKCVVLPVDEDTAVEAARIKKKEGLALADAFALASSRKMNATLVTGDPDFKGVNGVLFIGSLRTKGY